MTDKCAPRAELLGGRRPQRERKVKRDRRHAVRIRQAREKGSGA